MGTRAGRVLLVEDHECVAAALVYYLSSHGMAVERPVGLTSDAVLDKVREFKPDAVLLDFWLGECDSMPLIAPLAATGARVAMFTAMESRVLMGACFAQGAIGFVSKTQREDSLVDSVQKVIAGKDLITPEQRDALIEEARASHQEELERFDAFSGLSAREAQILRLMVEGNRPYDIARLEFISVTTVRTHIACILKKLEVNSQFQAVALARKQGWPPAPPRDPISDPRAYPSTAIGLALKIDVERDAAQDPAD